MTLSLKFLAALAAAVSLLLGALSPSPAREPEDRTLSPYFWVSGGDPQTDRLPLKSTSAAVRISGVIADVQVAQVYRNEGKRPLEAVYVFPASTRAAVYGMKMTIGERTLEAKIARRDEARLAYEQARHQGRSASLLEEQRPNVFQMSVANLMPGDEIRVELKYTELLVPTDRVYEFIYPSVVGPRYSNSPAGKILPGEIWVANPYLPEGEAPAHAFHITASLAAGMPIREVSCPSHRTHTAYDGPSSVTLRLDPAVARGGDRDYILRYRLAGERVQTGLLLSRGEKENFFLLMVQPPARAAREEIPGREYIFIVDVSGSMHGFPLEVSKKLMGDLIGNLGPQDRFNLLLFAGGSSVLSGESLPANPENVRKALHLIERQRGGGGTELLPALERALKIPRAENFSRTLVIATDGYVTVEEEVFDLIRGNLGQANLFAFGIGTAVNRHLIEGMARAGMGEPFVITRPQEAPAQAERFRKMIETPLLTRVQVGFQGFEAYDVEPQGIPDVLAERPVVVFGKWRGQPRGKILLQGVSGNGPHREAVEVEKVEPFPGDSALAYLWARQRISRLSDANLLRHNDRRAKEVADLGLAYSLLTAHTSFVAVDSQARNPEGGAPPVMQPLPLPQGVSGHAAGIPAVSLAQSPRKGGSADFYARLFAGKAGPKEKEEEPASRPAWEVIASQGLSKEAVLRALGPRMEEAQGCFAGSLPGGKLGIELAIGPDGRVRSATVVSGSPGSEEQKKCLLDRIRTWTFPAPAKGREARATISLSFGK